MITGADKRVSSAFLATLREEPSSSAILASFTRKAPIATNVVKVDGLDDAIARAEDAMRERARSSSRPDIFDSLSLTDDASGPALYQPYIPTPIPPRPASSVSPPPTLMLPPPAMLPMFASMLTPSPPPVAPAPIIVLDRQSFYHPTVPQAFAAEPPSRRSAWTWFAVAFMTPLMVVTLVAAVITLVQARHQKLMPVAATSTMLVAPPAEAPAAAPTPVVEPSEPPMLVVEVKTLKSAPPHRKLRRP